MGYFESFGFWVRRRRKLLDYTQAELARMVSCSLSMLRKIERDERRPSEQLAELLANQLAIDNSQRGSFLKLARGMFVADVQNPVQAQDILIPIPTEFNESREEQTPFVARGRELLLLHEHLSRAVQGQGRIVFIAGEAGRGKTSLLYEFARQAMDAHPGLIVAGGSSDIYADQGDPLLPFKDIFRLLAGNTEISSMQGLINRKLATRLVHAVPLFSEILLEYGPHLIDTLVPGRMLEARLAQGYPKNSELLLRLQGQRVRQRSQVTHELLQGTFFEEVSATLNALAQQQPLMLLVDDLHWVDHSTAALLGHLAIRLKQSSILIIGSYRPEDLAQRRTADEQGEPTQHPLQEVLSESLRQFGQNRIDLDYSDPGEELKFINALLDIYDNEFGEMFRRQLARLTEGHPLFVVELLRDMRERGDIYRGDDGRWRELESMNWDNFPARVEGVIEKRIARLPDDLRFVLNIGSVQGETFFSEIIAQVSQTDASQLARWLSTDLDQRHRLIHEQGLTRAGAERLSQYRFRHHLFQKYLYEHLAAAERMYLHEAVGNALEALCMGRASTEELPAAQLARHFREARLSEKASQYLLLAGQKAARVLAFDEAVIHFEHGIAELEHLERTSEINRVEYELSLAMARALWHGGKVIESLTAYQDAIEIARTLDDSHALARAVLAYEEPRWRLNLDSEIAQQFMREALAALGDEQSGLRVRLLVGLARTLVASGEQEELRTTVDQAVNIARQIDDPLALCDALRITVHIDRRPGSTSERLAAIQELISTARSIGDQERLADGLDLHVYDLLELGQIDLVDQTIETQRQVAHEIKQPFQMHIAAVFQTMRVIMQGEFEKAERLAKEAADISERIGIAEMDGIYGTHMFTIRREQGRIHEIAPVVKLVVANNPESSAWRPGLALIYSILGQRQECKAVFEALASDGFSFVPQDSLWVATLAFLSEVCAFLEDRDRAAALYDLLLPYDGRTVVVGGATVCYGAAARYLGMLARTRLDWDSAEWHFREAMDLDERMGAWPWLAHSHYEYAAMLLGREQANDRERAVVLLNEALIAAQKMGMVHLAKKVEDIQSRYMPSQAKLIFDH
jgi:transcriptional regulator with XRE-family HTH domain/tetratricopeptide (TPR) repeat protein